jgi:hypothetical protein
MFAVRYEKITDDPSVSSLKSIDATGGSFHYKLSAETELRLEYTKYNFKNLNEVKWTESRSNLAAVIVF